MIILFKSLVFLYFRTNNGFKSKIPPREEELFPYKTDLLILINNMEDNNSNIPFNHKQERDGKYKFITFNLREKERRKNIKSVQLKKKKKNNHHDLSFSLKTKICNLLS